MDENINVAEILKDKPEGTKLWTDMFGSVTLYVVTDVCDAFQVKHHNKEPWFDKDGKLCKEGVLCIYPSKSMRDWRKFAWKIGDALSCGVDNLCIFEKWANKEYTEFYAKFVTPNYSGNTFKTEKWSKETNEAVIKQYISNIEEFKGGKLNLTTLEIEKTHPEFKDGDVLFVKCNDSAFIEIFNYFKNDELYDHASLCTTQKMIDIRGKYRIDKDEITEIRLATKAERQQLFSALAKKGKVWDSEKKQIVDLKPKWITPKPFDRVITRNAYDNIWTANIFSHMDSYGKYVTIGCVGGYPYCLPYNEETAHLLGTTDEWKEGE